MRPVVKLNKDGSERLMLGDVIWKEKPARKKARRTTWRFSVELLRLREVEKVIKDRHGGMIPDAEDTDDREICLDYLKAAAFSLSGQDMFNWCRKWAPWVREAELIDILAQASRRRRMMTADGVAGLLAVTWEHRTRLNLKTFGACDISKEERAKVARERKRERDRGKKAEARKARGCKDRESYEAASLSAVKPWKTFGMSRATWYRQGKPEVETSPSRIDSLGNGDTLVSSRQKPSFSRNTGGIGPDVDGYPAPSPVPSSLPTAAGEAGRVGGRGSATPAEVPGGGASWDSRQTFLRKQHDEMYRRRCTDADGSSRGSPCHGRSDSVPDRSGDPVHPADCAHP